MKMKLVRIFPAGNEYAMPLSKYSDLPCFRIQDGKPSQTNFSWSELAYIVDTGRGEVVGDATLTLTLERSK